MKQRCFVIMPYGDKLDADGKIVHFDQVYAAMIEKGVARVPDLECVRCDDIEQPGWIHERMLTHILEDQVAVVDTSTNNPNVFYELGVRHALRKSVTVLVHQKGTTPTFNIGGLDSIQYEVTPEGLAAGAGKIQRYIENALANASNTDSLVYAAIPTLEVRRVPNRITSFTVSHFRLLRAPEKRIGFVTGDREDIKVGHVWVTSENTHMQMDTFFGKSTSATIRYLGAVKNELGKLVEDVIAKELAAKMGTVMEVDPGTVIVTGPGQLARNGVRWVFHVAAVAGEPREGYRPVTRLDRCVKNSLRRVSELPDDGLTSILFPIFGTGPAGGRFESHARICIDAAIDYLETAASPVKDVLFYVVTDTDLQVCREIMRNHTAIGPQAQ